MPARVSRCAPRARHQLKVKALLPPGCSAHDSGQRGPCDMRAIPSGWFGPSTLTGWVRSPQDRGPAVPWRPPSSPPHSFTGLSAPPWSEESPRHLPSPPLSPACSPHKKNLLGVLLSLGACILKDLKQCTNSEHQICFVILLRWL